jgi:hypothetical protein
LEVCPFSCRDARRLHQRAAAPDGSNQLHLGMIIPQPISLWQLLIVVTALLGVAVGFCTAEAATPSTIYMYDLNQGSAERNALMASLSGIVARTTADVAMGYQFGNSSSDPEFWVDRYIDDHPGVGKVWQGSVPWFIDRYKSQLSGYVVYDAATINEATSVAGALGAVMVDSSLLSGSVGSALNQAGLAQVADVRGRNSAWVYANYGAQLNKDLIFRQQPQFSFQLRSYAVANSGFVFNATGAERDAYLAGQNDHSLVYGWGYNNDEGEFFGSASRHNLMGVPADHYQSSAALSKWDAPIPLQSSHTSPATPTEPGKHYVAFVMSDGDNVQWLTNDFARSNRWFGSPHRGNFDMTFDMSPALREANPVAMKYIYEEAAGDAHRTFFVAAGGEGLNYPSQTPDIAGFMDASIAAMQAVDQNIISVLDDSPNMAKLEQMVERPEIMGLMLKTGNAYKGRNGQIHWHEGKPIVSVKYSLWDGFDTPNQIISALNAAPTDSLHNQASYTIVNVHPWSTSLTDGGQGDPMSNVNYIVNNLANSVNVVTLEELMIHLRNNFGDSVDPMFGKNLLRNGDFETPAASPANRPAEWFYAPNGTELVVGQDSDGVGERAAALNQANVDWRSREVEVRAGEQLEFSFDFKFVNVPANSGFRADARFFTGSQDSGGVFAGESATFLDAADYAAGEWHTFTTTVVVPASAPVGDVRFSTYFGQFNGGQALIDNVRLLRQTIPGDFNADGEVTGADLQKWKIDFGSSAGSDADGDGDSDGADFLVWQRNLGQSAAAVAAAAPFVAVPEPSAAICALIGAACLATVQR